MLRGWFGADPGDKGRGRRCNFGVAFVDELGRICCETVSSVDDALNWIVAAGRPLGVGIDAPLWWSGAPGGWRRVDRRLRDTYQLGSTVQCVNSLQGAALAGGMLLASRLREEFPKVQITESHPKALLKALNLQGNGAIAEYFGIHEAWADDHQRDAAIAAVCAREGFQGNWTLDLAEIRDRSEQDPRNYWLRPVSYFWKGNASKFDGFDGQFGNRRELLVKGPKRCEHGQQGLRLHRLDDQSFPILPHDGFGTGKLELAGDSYRLVPPVLEELDMPFGDHDRLQIHMLKYMPQCMSIGRNGLRARLPDAGRAAGRGEGA